jgi:hypothetical protein
MTTRIPSAASDRVPAVELALQRVANAVPCVLVSVLGPGRDVKNSRSVTIHDFMEAARAELGDLRVEAVFPHVPDPSVTLQHRIDRALAALTDLDAPFPRATAARILRGEDDQAATCA